MKFDTPRKQALGFLAAYDTPGADAGDRQLVRIARTWLSIIDANYPVQRIVDGIMDEFESADPDQHGCGWQDLRKKFTAWAVREEWIPPH